MKKILLLSLVPDNSGNLLLLLDFALLVTVAGNLVGNASLKNINEETANFFIRIFLPYFGFLCCSYLLGTPKLEL